MMIQDKLEQLAEIKADLKSALIDAGVQDVTDVLNTYPDLIKSLEYTEDIYSKFFELIPGEYIKNSYREDEKIFISTYQKYKYKFADDVFVRGLLIKKEEVENLIFPDLLSELKDYVNNLTETDSDIDIYTNDISDEQLKWNSVYIAYATYKGYNVIMKDRTYKAHSILFASSFDSAEHRTSISTSYQTSTWYSIMSDDYGILTKDKAEEWKKAYAIGVDKNSKNYITTLFFDIREATQIGENYDVYLDSFPILSQVYIFSNAGPKGHYGTSPNLKEDNIIYNPIEL